MKKNLIVILMLLFMGNLLWCDLQDHYKKGKIALNAVGGFGQGNDWVELFYDGYKDMTVTVDGSIFVANSRTHNIYKFNKQGKLIKKFGRKGEGPGDFVSPGDLGVLDKKYLVVSEYASKRRFSLWDLYGQHVRVVRTKTSIFYLTPLRDNRVAYYTYKQHAQKKNNYQSIISIIIKDISSGNEKILDKITLFNRSFIPAGKTGGFTIKDFFAQVYLSQTINGNLAVGVSSQPKIKIYTPTGERLHSFSLKMIPISSANGYVRKFRDNYRAELAARDVKGMSRSRKYWHDLEKKAMRRYDFSNMFDTYLPLYKEIMVDSEGNFLIFMFTECLENCTDVFQVYSKEGNFICETQLDTGSYQLKIDRRFKKLCFTSQGIYGLFMQQGDEDETLKLIKSTY